MILASQQTWHSNKIRPDSATMNLVASVDAIVRSVQNEKRMDGCKQIVTPSAKLIDGIDGLNVTISVKNVNATNGAFVCEDWVTFNTTEMKRESIPYHPADYNYVLLTFFPEMGRPIVDQLSGVFESDEAAYNSVGFQHQNVFVATIRIARMIPALGIDDLIGHVL